MKGEKKTINRREIEEKEPQPADLHQNWAMGLENHKRLMQILPFLQEMEEGYL
jgi:hypothetical protein